MLCGSWDDDGRQAVDLLTKMLMFNPSKRITIDEALEHPFLSALHSIDDEPVAESVYVLRGDASCCSLSSSQSFRVSRVACARAVSTLTSSEAL